MAGVLAEAAIGVPAPALRALVGRYVGYHYRGFPPGVHLGLPAPELTIVISMAPPTRVTWDPDGAPTRHDALASGLHSRPAFIHHDGEQHGVQLALTPRGARVLFGVPAAALARAVVDFDDVADPLAAGLPARLAGAGGWPSRFALLDEVLTALAARAAARHAVADLADPLAYAWTRLRRSGGALRVGELAADLGWSRRHLSGRFAAEFGVGPKEAARIMRFDRSRRMLLSSGPVPVAASGGRESRDARSPSGPDRMSRPDRMATLAGVATACGYYDQPHLVRDWHDLAGMAPSAWLATEDLPPPGTA